MTSKTFNMDDIHQIRYENYEITKDMTPDEIIRKTKCDAEEGKKLIEEIRSRNKAGYYAIYG